MPRQINEMPDMKALLRKAMDELRIEDNDRRTALAAICMGESALDSKAEVGYAHTSNERIRSIFPTACGHMDDAQLDSLKADPQAFFDVVYGGRLGNNPGTHDGYNFRGRGFIQLTGRENYEKIGTAINEDLTTNPDRANDPAVAAKIACEYILQRYHGGGFDGMVRCVGNSIPDVYARKLAFYNQFSESGEFNIGSKEQPAPFPTTGLDPDHSAEALNHSFLQRILTWTRIR